MTNQYRSVRDSIAAKNRELYQPELSEEDQLLADLRKHREESDALNERMALWRETQDRERKLLELRAKNREARPQAPNVGQGGITGLNQQQDVREVDALMYPELSGSPALRDLAIRKMQRDRAQQHAPIIDKFGNDPTGRS